ncbi:MAG TPA: LytTR family DNA-binding domain-containing protein [Thermoanaerobaculia bacterium]|jgi:two-component system LytT family response regulator
MNTIRAIIVEDEPLARTRLRHLLDKHPDVKIVAESGNTHEAATLLERGTDLVFLDVQLSEGSGLDVLRGVDGDKQPVVVFTTAHSEYALEAFDLDVADYLVKPFDAERLSRALDRVRRVIAGGKSAPTKPRGERRERFAVRARGEIVFVKTSEVDWISAEGNYARLHTGNLSYLLRESMQSLDDTLDPDTFIRVHRSAIVNLERVQKLIAGSEGTFSIVLDTGAVVPLGPSYRGRLEQVLGHKL